MMWIMAMTMVGTTEMTTRRADRPWFLLLFWLEVEGRKAWAF